MTLKEFVETNEKINEYKESGKLTIELASDLEELEDDYDIEHEKVNLIKTMRQVLENNKIIEQKLANLINLFENLQEQVDSIEIDSNNIV